MSPASAPLIIAALGMASPFDMNFMSPQLRVNEINWRWRNQRQTRKNRRRKHAAGARNAFA